MRGYPGLTPLGGKHFPRRPCGTGHVSVPAGVGVFRWSCLQGPSCSNTQCAREGSQHAVSERGALWLGHRGAGNTPHTRSAPAPAE